MSGLFRKTYEIQRKAIDEDAGIFEAMISTESIDRMGDIVVASGADLKNYLRNPVVLFGHEYQDPERVVGRGLEIEKIPKKGIRARWEFAPWGTSIGSDVTRRLWTAGFLNATSIGFNPDWEKTDTIDENGDVIEEPNTGDPSDEWMRYFIGHHRFNEWELLEFSLVPVPANQDALRLAVRGAIEKLDIGRARARIPAGRNETPEARILRSFFAEYLGEAEADPIVWITRSAVLKPFPNEHACRLRNPDDFEDDSFRRSEREHEGKTYAVIQGRLTGEKTLTDQAFRYPKDSWGVEEARSHCEDHDGSFEAASSGEDAFAPRNPEGLRPPASRSTLSPAPAAPTGSAPTDADFDELTEGERENVAGKILELVELLFPTS